MLILLSNLLDDHMAIIFCDKFWSNFVTFVNVNSDISTLKYSYIELFRIT